MQPVLSWAVANVIVYRDDVDWRSEKESAKLYFICHNSRMLVRKDDLVIARFSALPFYKEQEEDYKIIGAKMINSYSEHTYVADLGNWYFDLQDVTPRTWNELHTIPDTGPFVLKGETNSKKFLFNTHMFAQDKAAAIAVHSRLCEDSLLQYQKIYIREFVPLYTYMEGLQGLPITKEFRFFAYRNKILCGAYYWESHRLDLEEMNIFPDVNEVPKNLLDKIANVVGEMCNFYAIDVAQTKSGEWILIELNDGQMSGLSANDPNVMYKNLKAELEQTNY